MDKKLKKAFYAGVLYLTVFGTFALAQPSRESLRPKIEEFVEQSIIQELVKTNMDILQRMGIQLFPQLGYLAAQQTAEQCLKQDHTREMIKDIYLETVDAAMEKLESGASGDALERTVKNSIEQGVKPMIQDRVYQYILEEVVKQTMNNQQKIIMSQVIGQRQRQAAMMQMAQQAAVQQMVQQAVMQQVAQSVMQQQMAQQYNMPRNQQQAIQQQQQFMNRSLQQEYRNALGDVLSTR